MSEPGLLAHLRNHFHVPPENLATETLAFILNESKRARDAWQQLIHEADDEIPPVNHHQTQVRSGSDGSIPDLVGVAEGGSQVVVGEVKFEAGLTNNQPTAYISRLLRLDEPSLLLFIVPERRMLMVWNEIRRKSKADGTELEAELHPAPWPKMRVSRHNRVSVGIVSWTELLNRLENNLLGDRDPKALWDVRELRAMCDEQERHAFLPLEERDLESRVSRRIIELDLLLREITSDVLKAEGTASKLGSLASPRNKWMGRYMMIAGWWCMLQLNWELWATARATPVWLMINDSRVYGYEPLIEALLPLSTEDPPRLLTRDGGIHYIPIYPKLRAERDIVREDISAEVQKIAELMWKAPAPEASEAVE